MRPAGLEPAAYWFEASRSIQLSYGRTRTENHSTGTNTISTWGRHVHRIAQRLGMTVGSYLRTARERRRLTLDEVSERTKIKPALLVDLENNDVSLRHVEEYEGY